MGPIRIAPELVVKAVRCNMEDGEQVTIWLMICNPLTFPDDLKVLIRERFSKIPPPRDRAS